MAKNYLSPGVYVEEISNAYGTVTEVASAIPAFIGYTEKTACDGRNLQGVPEPVSSYQDFVTRFGEAAPLYLKAINIKTDDRGRFSQVESVQVGKRFLLHDAMRMYFANGGGNCFVASLGPYAENAGKPYDKAPFEAALEALEAVDDVTLLVMPEAVLLGDDLYSVQQAALKHCDRRQNRFAILDMKEEDQNGSILLNWQNQPDYDKWRLSYQEFRDRVGIDSLGYGAAYTPYVVADVPVQFSYVDIRDYFFNPEDKSNPKPPLWLGDLDPTVKKSVQALDMAIADQTNLEAAVKEARIKLDSSAASIMEAVRKKLADFSESNMQTLAAVCFTLCGKLTGQIKLEAGDKDYSLSPDLAQHTLDELNRILEGIKKSLPGYTPPQEPASRLAPLALLEELKATLAGLKPEKPGQLQPLLDEFVQLFGDDLYQTTLRNVERLSNGLAASSAVYRSIVQAVQTALRVQPPSAMMAGIYASVDRERGVWKAPANVSANSVLRLTQTITAQAQEVLNSDAVAGKSINALRTFPGKGFLIWGARTLDGNSMDWRYVPVRRFISMLEESVRRSTSWVVSEPNDASLWAKAKGTIDNYLLQKWKDGAVMGAAPSEAYYVNVGLGSTMNEQDILEGRLIIEVGVAVVRPAEFITFRLTYQMQKC
ncbi:phage tail sheath subtilisin-like domain-containing protein [Desulfovibrio sp. OttesenSCG-928-C06]|nr:phage tail sheath subtilisin-like domain-containing protein [Desulfovibrio sp. OttesenSCG-928-C06]